MIDDVGMDEQDPNSKLAAMQQVIEKQAENIRTLKEKYTAECADNPDAIRCNLSKTAIEKYISSLKEAISEYNQYAVTYEIDITVEVWMIDVDQVTAEP